MSSPIEIPLRALRGISWSQARRLEPLTFGVPFPIGAVASAADLSLECAGRPHPIQARTLDHWPDGSVRWALVDTVIDAEAGRPGTAVVRATPGAAGAGQDGIRVVRTPSGVDVSTGAATFGFAIGGAFPLSSLTVHGATPIEPGASGLRIEHDGRLVGCEIASVVVRDDGPLRAEIDLQGRLLSADLPFLVFARIEVFAGTATVRIRLTVRNMRRARHPSGQWTLGDAGSVLLRSLRLDLHLAGAIGRIRCAPEPGTDPIDVERPFEILQESSGGDRWNSAVHRNRDGQVPLRFRGYRIRSGATESVANRASPVVVVETSAGPVAVAVPMFWQNFPRAIAVAGSAIRIGLFAETGDPIEIQGGEQKSHDVVLAFAEDRVSDIPLAWCHDPVALGPSPEWYCATGVLPCALPGNAGFDTGYLRLVDAALDPEVGFARKRETADEYGWRNFGDLPADHESAFQPEDQPFVSHYNNQYDAIAGFAMHFMRTGDFRWRELMDDLARHVRDIDIYHTAGDKAAYNGGLFWHTAHYIDAGTSTHRTYPRGGPESGGPSAEHNYTAGLMWHYFLTGDRASKDAAVGLADWVLRMDDGRLTPFRWLAGGATGLASATGSLSYHGPGRGGANSVTACLVAHRLTGDDAYRAKADELVRRCVHPRQDLDALGLLDVERRWYYTVFLQALGMYLHEKQERRQFDEMFAYAQASLLHYARWMAGHERPYLSRPEILEHPTETWAAQDMRKAEVFQWAAMHAGAPERDLFLERAEYFFRYSVDTLEAMPGRRFTRPIVLMLSNGLRHAWFRTRAGSLPPPPPVPALPPSEARAFEPQKIRAIRRAGWLALLGVVISGALIWLASGP